MQKNLIIYINWAKKVYELSLINEQKGFKYYTNLVYNLFQIGSQFINLENFVSLISEDLTIEDITDDIDNFVNCYSLIDFTIALELYYNNFC